MNDDLNSLRGFDDFDDLENDFPDFDSESATSNFDNDDPFADFDAAEAPAQEEQAQDDFSVFDLDDLDEPAFSEGDVDELPDDFIEEEGPGATFLWIGGALALVFVLIMVSIIGVAATSGDNSSEETATAVAERNLLVQNNATSTAVSVATIYAVETSTAAAFGTQSAAGTSTAYFGSLTAEAENALATDQARINGATLTKEFILTRDAPTATSTPTSTPTPVPVSGGFSGPPGFDPAGVEIGVYSDADGDGEPPVFPTPTPSGPTPTVAALNPTPGTAGPTAVPFLGREVVSDNGLYAVDLPEEWFLDRRLPNPGGFVAFASDNTQLDFLINNVDNPALALSLPTGQGGTITISDTPDLLNEEELFAFFEFYINDKVDAAGASFVQEPEAIEDADNPTLVAIFDDGTTQGYITLISFGDVFADVTTMSATSEFAASSSILQLITDSVRQIDTTGEPTAVPTTIVLPTATLAPAEAATAEPDAEATAEATEEAGTPVGYVPGNGSTSNTEIFRRVIPAQSASGDYQPESTPTPEELDGTPPPDEPEETETPEATEAPEDTPTATPDLPDAEPATTTPPLQSSSCDRDTPINVAFDATGNFQLPLLEPDCLHFLRLTLDDRFVPGAYQLQIGNEVVSFNVPPEPGESRQRFEILQGDGTFAEVELILVGTGAPLPEATEDTTPQPSNTPTLELDPFELTATALVGVVPPTATLPDELPQGGFFDDLSSGDSSSSLLLLAFLGAGLLAIVIAARRLRTIGQGPDNA